MSLFNLQSVNAYNVFGQKLSNMCVNDAFINALLCIISINTEESVDKTINIKMSKTFSSGK